MVNTIAGNGNESFVQNYAAFDNYTADPSSGSLDATGVSPLGTTVAGAYSSASALHYTVTIWLEGWHATGNTAATSIWSAADYLGKFQLGMRFGITDYGQE